MIQVFKIDLKTGLFIEPVVLEKIDDILDDMIEHKPTDGLFKPLWNGLEWVEGMVQDEIDKIKNLPDSKSDIQILQEQNASMFLEMAQKDSKINQVQMENANLLLELANGEARLNQVEKDNATLLLNLTMKGVM